MYLEAVEEAVDGALAEHVLPRVPRALGHGPEGLEDGRVAGQGLDQLPEGRLQVGTAKQAKDL